MNYICGDIPNALINSPTDLVFACNTKTERDFVYSPRRHDEKDRKRENEGKIEFPLLLCFFLFPRPHPQRGETWLACVHLPAPQKQEGASSIGKLH